MISLSDFVSESIDPDVVLIQEFKMVESKMFAMSELTLLQSLQVSVFF